MSSRRIAKAFCQVGEAEIQDNALAQNNFTELFLLNTYNYYHYYAKNAKAFVCCIIHHAKNINHFEVTQKEMWVMSIYWSVVIILIKYFAVCKHLEVRHIRH